MSRLASAPAIVVPQFAPDTQLAHHLCVLVLDEGLDRTIAWYRARLGATA